MDTELTVDFICEQVADIFDNYALPCELLTEIDDVCYDTCDYCCPQPQCWKRYFQFLKENEDCIIR